MTQGGMRRTNKNYGDSPGRRGSLSIASSLFESCSRIPTLPTRNRLASSTRGTVLRLPLRVDSGVLASPAKRVPRDPAPTLCRALMMQAVQTALGARDARQRKTTLLIGVAGKKLLKYLAECCSDVQLRKHSQPAKPDTMD